VEVSVDFFDVVFGDLALSEVESVFASYAAKFFIASTGEFGTALKAVFFLLCRKTRSRFPCRTRSTQRLERICPKNTRQMVAFQGEIMECTADQRTFQGVSGIF